MNRDRHTSQPRFDRQVTDREVDRFGVGTSGSLLDSEYRQDGGLVKKYEVDPATGWVTADASIARIGVQEYRNADGSIRREYRPAEEVSDPDSLASFKMLPHCLEHPPVLLQKENSQQYQVGFTSSDVIYDRGYVKTRIKITDAQAIRDALDGVRVEISCGYTCKLDWTPGVFDGQPYDCIQRKIRGNHTAQVRKGRAGSNVKLHLDSSDAIESLNISPIDRQNNGIDPAICLTRFDSDEIDLESIYAANATNTKSLSNNAALQAKGSGGLSEGGLTLSFVTDVCATKNKQKRNRTGANMDVGSIKKEMAGMSDSEKVAYLMQKYSEMQEEMSEMESEKQDAQNIAALHEGRAARWKQEVEARGDSGGGVSSQELEKAQRRAKEKDIRIDSLSNEIDDLKGQISTLRQQLNTQVAKSERLDTELVQERESKVREIVQQRRDWLVGYQKVEKYLPANAKEELSNNPTIADTCPALYRLALQHNRPELNLDSRSDSEITAMFDMMNSEMTNRRGGNNPGYMGLPQQPQQDLFRVKVDAAKNSFQPPSNQPVRVDDIRIEQMRKSVEAWQVTN